MRKLLFILLFLIQVSVFAQSEKVLKVWYQDTSYLFLDNEKYNSWAILPSKLKEHNVEGEFIVYYDKLFTDTAIAVNIKNGNYEGFYREWDRKDKYISKKVFYSNGEVSGIDETYFYLFPELDDIENYVHRDSVLIEVNDYANDTIRYERIHRSKYEMNTGIIRKEED